MEIPGYDIQRKLGQGGMAVVYLAIQESLQRPIALKVLNPLLCDNERFSERFIREGRILASLNHNNIITIHDIGIADGYHFISMEYVAGPDLKTRLKRSLSPREAVDYLKTVCSCLGFAHSKGIVHRDVKPANILFRTDGTLLLSDFGIAKQLDGSTDITLTGTPMGSPNYLSPEQAQGLEVTERADIYSCGAIFYEMLTGEKAFRGTNQVDTIVEQLKGQIPELPYRLRSFQPLIDRMLAREPVDRPANMSEVLDTLSVIADTGSSSLEVPLAHETLRGRSSPPPVDAQADTVVPDVTEIRVPPADLMGRSRLRWLVLAGVAATTLGYIGVRYYPSSDSAPETSQPVAQSFTPVPLQRPDEVVPAASPVSESKISASTQSTAGTIPPSNAEAFDLDRLLELGNRALAQDHLTTPTKDNARYYYLQVLNIESSNRDARLGMKRIVNRYAALAQSAIKRADYDAASRYILAGKSLEFSHPALVELQRELMSDGLWHYRAKQSNSEKPIESPPEVVEKAIERAQIDR